MRTLTMLGATLAATITQAPISAQSGGSLETITAEKDRLVADKDRINAEKDRLNAQAELERARISSLSLPSYENKTTLTEGAGKTEALIKEWNGCCNG